MSELAAFTHEISIPSTLEVLDRLLLSEVVEGDLKLPLRALQFRGLSKLDLVVFIERARERNALTGDDEQVEENCLYALDVIHGVAGSESLSWNAQHEATSLLARCLDAELIGAAMQHGLLPSDLMPPRPKAPRRGHIRLESTLAEEADRVLKSAGRLAARADLFRVPKGPFTTRPAALMTVPDRLALEALAGLVENSIQDRLPIEVLWPRRRDEEPDRMATAVALSWESQYVAKADISNFYEAVDHSLLAVFLISHCDLNVIAARAIEALLTSTMGLPRGLPQGPPASDVLASAYLLPLDSWLTEQGIKFVRYADDYFFAAESVGDGKQTLVRFEQMLQELGLSLNTSKTQVMRRETFAAGLRTPSAPLLRLKNELADQRVGELKAIEDRDELAALLEEAGVDEETLFGLLYHRTIDLDEVLAEFSDELLPSLLDTYQTYLAQVSAALEHGIEGDLSSYERLTREALTVMSLAEPEIEPGDLRRVVTWFPRLAPLASTLISAAGQRGAAWAGAALRGHIRSESGFDWVNAWFVHAVVDAPELADQEVLRYLNSTARRGSSGPLSKLEAVRALNAVGVLSHETWNAVFDLASVPMQSEMIFSAMGQARRVPWLTDGGGVEERRIALAVRSLEVE